MPQTLTLSTGAPQVTLRNAPPAAYDGAIAAARTCYSPRVIAAGEVTERQREHIGKLTYDGGHHTVYQHAHFEFGLENVSRHLVWGFLHSHPFYNSEQQSQRYVRLNEPRAYVPPIEGEAKAIYERAILDAWTSYAALAAMLKDDTFRILKELRYVTPRASAERLAAIAKEAEKKAIEVARYVIPLAAFTAMVHTVSGITLYRLWRMAASGDTPRETREVVGTMVDAVKAHDPQFFDRFAIEPIPESGQPEARFPRPAASREAWARAFDRKLSGRTSKLVDAPVNGEILVSDAVRAVFGLDETELPDEDALDRVMNPAKNTYRLDTLNVSYHSPLMRALHHVNYTFAKRISHTADSQDQRHRMVPASRPLLTFADTREPDYIAPPLILANPAARAEYDAQMRRAWDAKNRLLDLGVPLEHALYVLPNAKVIRFHETGPLIALVHKWTMRTCFNAQEEIYRASIDEVEQVRAVHPRLGRYLGPPCVIRNGLISPRCTEGTHFCGVPVWLNWPGSERRL